MEPGKRRTGFVPSAVLSKLPTGSREVIQVTRLEQRSLGAPGSCQLSSLPSSGEGSLKGRAGRTGARTPRAGSCFTGGTPAPSSVLASLVHSLEHRKEENRSSSSWKWSEESLCLGFLFCETDMAMRMNRT